MNIVDARDSIVAEATASALRGGRYAAAGAAETTARMDGLFAVLVESLAVNDVAPLARHAARLAEDRFSGGYGLGEVQAAVNALEEALWRHVFATCPLEELGDTLRTVSTALGTTKDVLAQEYVRLAVRSGTPSLDLSPLFAGTAAGFAAPTKEST